MKISIGSDHGAFDLKEELKAIFGEIEFIDKGCFDKSSVDYPDFAENVCQDIKDNNCDFGILLCTTGIGMSMAANKHKQIRAALCLNEDMAKYTRLHNNANLLCLGAKYTNIELAKQIVETFISTQFEGGRHQNRVAKFSI